MWTWPHREREHHGMFGVGVRYETGNVFMDFAMGHYQQMVNTYLKKANRYRVVEKNCRSTILCAESKQKRRTSKILHLIG